jgi:ABC-type siderophore export system fused ATPase/permease subunit
MNSPVNQLVEFFRSLQDAKLSLDRLNEVQNHSDEELPDQLSLKFNIQINNSEALHKGIVFENVSFQYAGPKSQLVLRNINLVIPEGKETSIVAIVNTLNHFRVKFTVFIPIAKINNKPYQKPYSEANPVGDTQLTHHV